MKVTERIRMMMAEKQKEGDDGRQEEDEWQRRRTNAGSDLTGGVGPGTQVFLGVLFKN